MRVSKGQAHAWLAHDAASAALQAYWSAVDPARTGQSLSTEQAECLVKLSAQVLAWQERIRIHRRQTIPGVAPRVKPKASKGRAERAASVGQGLPAVPVPTAERPTPSESEGEQGEHLGQSHDADG